MTEYKDEEGELDHLMTPRRAFIVFQFASDFHYFHDKKIIKFNPLQERALTHELENNEQQIVARQENP